MNNEGWIEGQVPRLLRQAAQAEYQDGGREISLCPACNGGFRRGKVVRYRLLSPEIKQAYVNGVVREPPREGEQHVGERLKSKCCNADMVIVAGDDPVASTNYYLCLHCLRGADMKEMK